MEGIALLTALSIAVSSAVGFYRGKVSGREELSLQRPRAMPGSAPRGQDARDLSSFDAWNDHPGFAVTPAGILAAFRAAERGYPQRQCDLIDDLVENDGTLRNLFEQREQSVAGKPRVVQADGSEADTELAARVMAYALGRLPMLQVLQHLLSVNRYGWACAEIDWDLLEYEGRLWIVPVWITPVPARRFVISCGTGGTAPVDELRLFTDVSRPQGDEMRATKWIVLRRSSAPLARSGLMRTGAWPAMGKRLGFRDWLVYSQRFGLPLPIVSYDDEEEVDDDDLAVAQEIIRKIGSDGGAVVPKSLELNFHDATRGNAENSKAHGGLINHCNAEMSKLVNGSTLSNDNAGSGGASYALGEVHAKVSWDNVLFDAELIQEAFRQQLFCPFMKFNDLQGNAPLLKIQVVRDLDPKTQAEIADILQNKLGVKVSQAQLRQVLGFREPSNDADAAPGAPIPAPAKALPGGGA